MLLLTSLTGWQPERLVGLGDFIVVQGRLLNSQALHFSPYLKINKNILKKLDNAKLQTTNKTKRAAGI